MDHSEETGKDGEFKYDTFIQLVDDETSQVIWEQFCGEFFKREILDFMQVEDSEFDGRYINSFDDETDALSEFFKIKIPRPSHIQFPRIELWNKDEGLPYRLHAGREFFLMKNKQKPLSYFYDLIPLEGDSNLEIDKIMDLFSELIDNGVLTYCSYCEIRDDLDKRFLGTRTDIYCGRGESWRINALVMIRNYERSNGRNQSTNNLIGKLLGYSDQQNEMYEIHQIAYRRDHD